jgi:hypothetical protein
MKWLNELLILLMGKNIKERNPRKKLRPVHLESVGNRTVFSSYSVGHNGGFKQKEC